MTTETTPSVCYSCANWQRDTLRTGDVGNCMGNKTMGPYTLAHETCIYYSERGGNKR